MYKMRYKGTKRLMQAAINSYSGLKAAWQQEEAFRQEVILLAVFLSLSFILETSTIGKVSIFLSGMLLLIVELLNSAIEAAVDRSGLEYNVFAKNAKDIASAAVFLTLILTCFISLSILIFRI